MAVNLLKQDVPLTRKIHAVGQNIAFQGCKNMERETLSGVNISNYSFSLASGKGVGQETEVT